MQQATPHAFLPCGHFQSSRKRMHWHSSRTPAVLCLPEQLSTRYSSLCLCHVLPMPVASVMRMTQGSRELQVLRGTFYNEKVDVFSLAIVAWELFSYTPTIAVVPGVGARPFACARCLLGS